MHLFVRLAVFAGLLIPSVGRIALAQNSTPGMGPDIQACIRAIRENPEALECFELRPSTPALPFSIHLGEPGIVLADGTILDGFRIKPHPGATPQNLALFFNTPDKWRIGASALIRLSDSKMIDPTNKFFLPRIPYDGFTSAEKMTTGYQLWGISAWSLSSNETYAVCLTHAPGETADMLEGRLALYPKPPHLELPPGYPERKALQQEIEQALGLAPAANDLLAKDLKSRGARILCDQDLFPADFASGRIVSAYECMDRHLDLMVYYFEDKMRADRTAFERGEPVKSEEPLHDEDVEARLFEDYLRQQALNREFRSTAPESPSAPLVSTMLARYGEADFVQGRREEVSVFPERQSEPAPPDATTYYFDVFGFEADGLDGKAHIRRVFANSTNFHEMRPTTNGLFFARLMHDNLALFYSGEKEVGRIYHFGHLPESARCITEPPPGIYTEILEPSRLGRGQVEYQGGGKWNWQAWDNDNNLRCRGRMSRHKLHGVFEGYHPDGSLSMKRNYSHGIINGGLLEYSEEGKLVSRKIFKSGRLVRMNVGDYGYWPLAPAGTLVCTLLCLGWMRARGKVRPGSGNRLLRGLSILALVAVALEVQRQAALGFWEGALAPTVLLAAGAALSIWTLFRTTRRPG